MLRNTLYHISTAALCLLPALAAQPGHAQTMYQADASSSITILTAPTSKFTYTLSPGNIAIASGSKVLSGDGTADGAGVVNTLNNNDFTPAPDTVQDNSYVTGTTGTSALKHGNSKIDVISNPYSIFTLNNKGNKNIKVQFVWTYDLYAQASSLRPSHDSASAASSTAFAFNDPQGSVGGSRQVSVSTNPGSASVELYSTVSTTYTVTVSAGYSDQLQLAVDSNGTAQALPEPGAVAMLVGLGCGFGGLIIRRRR